MASPGAGRAGNSGDDERISAGPLTPAGILVSTGRVDRPTSAGREREAATVPYECWHSRPSG